jgi:hypothetical protein
MEFYSIGIENKTERKFFKLLKDHHIDACCDIRFKKKALEKKYEYSDDIIIIDKMIKAGIRYGYVSELSNSRRLLPFQMAIEKGSDNEFVRKRMAERYAEEYRKEVLSKFDFDRMMDSLNMVDATHVVFFCFKEKSEDCQRWIIAEDLKNKYGIIVTEL